MNNIYKQYKMPAGAGGGLYLKLEDGQSVKLRLASEPYLFTDDKYGSTRFAWVVYNYDELKAQVLQLPATGYRVIASLAADDDWGEPTTYDIKVSREGTGLETRYHLTPSPGKTPLTAEQKAQTADIDMAKAVPTARPLAEFVESEPSANKPSPSSATTSATEADEEIDIEGLFS